MPFTTAMLSWPAGPRDSDGVWAPYWYDSVRWSTGFVPVAPLPEPRALPPELEPLAARCQPLLWLSLLALVGVAAGLAALRRRDIG